MNKYPWLMKTWRRDLLLLFICVALYAIDILIGPAYGAMMKDFKGDPWATSTFGLFYIFWPVFATIGIGNMMPPAWNIDHRGIRYQIWWSGRIEYDAADMIMSPEFQAHCQDMERIMTEGKLGQLKPPLEIGGVE